MAKVDGPLMSLEARGKIADAVVFFPWKGRHAVRQWLKPTNPKKTLQGYVRAALKAIGKEIEKIQSISGGDTKDSELYLANVAKAPAGLNWNAFHAQGILAQFVKAGTFDTSAFTAAIADYAGHSATAALDSEATALGLADFTFPYGYTTAIKAGCQLYFGALAAYNNGASWGALYTKDPASFTAEDVTAFAKAHTA
jgi:hypothetical protein